MIYQIEENVPQLIPEAQLMESIADTRIPSHEEAVVNQPCVMTQRAANGELMRRVSKLWSSQVPSCFHGSNGDKDRQLYAVCA